MIMTTRNERAAGACGLIARCPPDEAGRMASASCAYLKKSIACSIFLGMVKP